MGSLKERTATSVQICPETAIAIVITFARGVHSRVGHSTKQYGVNAIDIEDAKKSDAAGAVAAFGLRVCHDRRLV